MSRSGVPNHELRRLEVERDRYKEEAEEYSEKYLALASELPERLRAAYERGLEASVDEAEREAEERRERDELLARLYGETRITIAELAEVFEVSPATVSRAVREHADGEDGGQS